MRFSSYVKFHPFSSCVSHTTSFFWQYSQHHRRFAAESPSVAGTPPVHEPKNTFFCIPLINAFLQEEAQVKEERLNSVPRQITIISVYSFIYVFSYLVMDIRTAPATTTTVVVRFRFSAYTRKASSSGNQNCTNF